MTICDRHYLSPTKIPNRDKKTESPYLVHPLTYRQVYLTKDAYFVEKIHCELVEMAVGQRMNKIRFSCHKIYWFGFLVTIRNFRRAPVYGIRNLRNISPHVKWDNKVTHIRVRGTLVLLVVLACH